MIDSSRVRLDARIKMCKRYIIGYPGNLLPQDNKSKQCDSILICQRCQALHVVTGTAAGPTQMTALQYTLQDSLHIYKLCSIFFRNEGIICENQI